MSLIRTISYVCSHPVNRRHKFGALMGFARWQVASRLAPNGILCEWIGDSRLVVSRGEAGLSGNIYAGLHEVHDMGFLLHFLRADELFLDIGANRGSYTILASGVRRARTIAIEPAPSAYSKLSLNSRVNDLGDLVSCLNIGLAAQNGTLSFTANLDSCNHVLIEGVGTASQDSSTIEVATLDEVANEMAPSLIKIDVEGYEMPVLRGGEETLANESVKGIIVEINDSTKRYGYSGAELTELLRGYGFLPYEYDAFTRKLVRVEQTSSNSCNTIFVRNIEFARKRICESETFQVRDVTI